MIDSIKDALGKMTFLPNDELRLAFIGAIAAIIIFGIAFLISYASKMNALTSKIKKLIIKLAGLDKINENNVAAVYEEMKTLPAGVKKGWGNFLDQRTGYPSDYMLARDCIGASEYCGKFTVGKIVYAVASVILWAVLAIISSFVCAEDISSFGIADLGSSFSTVASILSTVLIPVVIFVIGYFGLAYVYIKQRKRLEMCFTSFQDIIDEKVLVSPKEEEEYVSESLEAIAAKVDALIDGRIDEDGVIEVLRLPDGIEEELPASVEEEEPAPVEEEAEEEVEEEEEVVEEEKEVPVDDGLADIVYPDAEDEEEAQPSEPVEEPAEEVQAAESKASEASEEEAPAEEPAPEQEEVAAPEEPVFEEPIILTEEEQERYLAVLPAIVEQAVNDPETTLQDLEELAEMIENARVNNFPEQADQDILIECLCTIADKYYQ